MSRLAETIGNIKGHIEFAREGVRKRWEESKTRHVLYPNLSTPLPASELLESVDFSESNQLIDKNGVMYVINGKPGDTPETAREYWLDKGMPTTEVNKIVDGGGHIRLHVKPHEYRRLIGHNPLKAALLIIDALAPVYDNNSYPLDASIPGIDGFNAHQRPHIRTVTQGAYDLLQQAKKLKFRKITRNTEIVTTRGAAGHDSDNVQSRRLHAKGAPRLLDHIIPSRVSDPLKDRVDAVMVFHNEPELRELLKKNTDGSTQEGITYLQKLDPAILATIIADKLHIGQDRLPPRWMDSEGILRDWNIGINAAFTTESAGFVAKAKPGRRSHLEDVGKFVVNIKYNETFEDEYFTPALGHTLTQDSTRYPNGRINLPEAIQAYIPNATHSEVLEAMLWKTYHERLRLTLMTIFAYNPNAESVEININDPDARRGLTKHLSGVLTPEEIEQRIHEVEHRRYLFTRDNIDQQLGEIQQKFELKGVHLEDLKKAGDELQSLTAKAA